MAKEAKKTEIIDLRTGEVTNVDFSSMLEEDASKDQQAFRQDQLTIPRITILQDLSPQVKQNSSEYIEGAVPGMIYNTVTGTITRALTIFPAYYTVRFIAWKPRKNGGGLVSSDVDERILTEANGFAQENPGKWIGKMAPRDGDDPVTVEVIMTGEWAAIARQDDGSLIPVAISFPGSKAKVGRKINTKVDLTEIPRKDRRGFFKPAPYAHAFTLMTGTETGPEGDFWNYVANHVGMIDMEAPDRESVRAYMKARDLRHSILAGEADFADVTDADQ